VDARLTPEERQVREAQQARLLQGKSRVLWVLMAVGAVYLVALRSLQDVADVVLVAQTTAVTAAGMAGVVLGLYICSRPAGNAIDLIFMERGGLGRLSKQWSGLGWLALNGATLVLGWLVIVLGAIQLAGRAR
jgi:hypothetical protein